MTLELIPQIEQALHTQTIRETTQQDFDKFSKLDELITGTRNILHLRYSWDTIQEDRVKRKENFDQLSEKDQQVTQEALIASLESNNSHLIPALFFIGRETDLGIIDEVPEDQRTNMEIAVRFLPSK